MRLALHRYVGYVALGASGQSDCISSCSGVPFQPVTHSLLPDQMRPGSRSEGKAAGCITPLLQLNSTDSPCVLICTVACNVCAFHFNLPCHFSPGQTLRKGRFLFSIHLLYEGSFSIFLSCPSPLPSHILVVQRGRYRGATLSLFPPLTQTFHIQSVWCNRVK